MVIRIFILCNKIDIYFFFSVSAYTCKKSLSLLNAPITSISREKLTCNSGMSSTATTSKNVQLKLPSFTKICSNSESIKSKICPRLSEDTVISSSNQHFLNIENKQASECKNDNKIIMPKVQFSKESRYLEQNNLKMDVGK